MGDSDAAKKPGVPSWQLTVKNEPTESGEREDPTADEPSREVVIKQAQKFLDEDEVRSASTDKKIAFLESKGLRSDEIQDLLGVARNTEASSAAERHEPRQETPVQAPPPVLQQAHPQPPIITYPEFLTTPAAPSPLITKTRLLTTLYLFSGLSALLYGTSTYLITPMLASLTSSRLSLAETASGNLSKLITQLESMVSEIPAKAHTIDLEDEREDDESDEDPTEMFHRDIGVQTSLPVSPSTSRPGSPTPKPSSIALNEQSSRLSSLKSALQGLVDDSTSEGHNVTELDGTIGVLKEYLDSMAYVTPNYGYGGMSGGYNGTGLYSNSKDQDDEISRVKAGIRGVKGVLLSARSFPGGVRASGR